MKTDKGRDLGIDGIRGLAILGVVLYHSAYSGVPSFHASSWKLLELGAQGVPIFFVVSGYLVSLPWVKWCLTGGERPSLKDYWMRRILRLEPPWLICFATFWLLNRWWGCPWTGEHVLPTVLYSHGDVYGTLSPLTPHSWSLEVEIRWYLLAPFVSCVMMYPKIWRRSFLTIAISSWPGYGHYFLAGLLVADLRLTGDHLRYKWLPWICLPLIPLATGLGLSLTAWLTALSLMQPPRLGWVVEGIGFRCYSIYLFHQLGQAQFFPQWAPSTPVWGFLWMIWVGLSIGLLGYYLVEVPSRSLMVRSPRVTPGTEAYNAASPPGRRPLFSWRTFISPKSSTR